MGPARFMRPKNNGVKWPGILAELILLNEEQSLINPGTYTMAA